MHLNNKILLSDIDAFIFDFDGVLTNNLVYINEDGKESVVCSRADGLAFDALSKLNKPTFILSTEKNQVVSERAKKINVPVIQGVNDKVEALNNIAKQKKFDFKKIFYIGNDLNDYRVMQLCGYTACPSDSHDRIKQISSVVLKANGGKGIVRELMEDTLGIDLIQILYK
jgi:3-deoxy-D-manno-octulosonate 8-phosphate phosphatase (KDO 8-P phosphatase)